MRPDSGDGEADELTRLLAGWRRTEVRRDGLWNVQPVSAAQAVKTYRCPGCNRDVLPKVEHVVTWRGDGVMGDEADIAARRHWHAHCWRIK